MNVGQVEFSIRVDGIEAVLGKLREVQNLANTIDGRKIQAGMGRVAKGTQTTAKGFADVNKGLTDYQSLLDRRTRQIAQWGSRMQTLGNGLQRITSPFFSVFKGAAMGLGYQMLGKFMNSISGAAQRYDTMRTYENVLTEIGIDASKKFTVGTKGAMTAIDNLEQSVLGLPTGLDEMVQSMRTYAGITNDVEKATKMAIAANNAFIAGGMDETRTRMAERQLQNLLSNGKLTAQQWNSLQKNMPLAFNAVGKALGYSNKNIKSFLADVKAGRVESEKFIDAFIKVGTEGSVERAAQKMKMTWNAVSQNIQNAFNRMGAGILDTMDNVFKKSTGRDFLQTVLGVDKNGNAVGGGIKDFIDGISQSIQGFIRNNPDKIIGFFDKLRSIDWKGMLTGYGDVLKFYANIFGGLMKTFGGRGFVVAMAGINMLGKGLGLFGSLARGLARPLARLSLAMGGAAGASGFAGFVRTMAGISPQMQIVADNLSGIRWTKNRLQAFQMFGDMQIQLQKFALINKALNIGAILAAAHSIKVVVGAFKELSSVDIKPGAVAALAGIGAGLLGMVNGLSAIGAALSASKIAMIGTGVASGAALAISKSIDWVADAMKKVAEAVNIVSEMELPSMEKVKSVAERAAQLSSAFRTINPFEAVGKMLDAISMNTEVSAIKNMAESIDSINKIADSKLKKSTMDKAFKNFGTLMDFADDITKVFYEGEKGLMERGGTLAERKGQSAAGKKYKSYAAVKGQIRDFGETISSISDAMLGMGDIITNSQEFEKKYAKISSHAKSNTFDWQHVKDHIGSIADGLYSIIDAEEGSPYQKLNTITEQLKNGKFENITSLFKEIPNMLSAISEAHTALMDSDLFGGNKVSKSLPAPFQGAEEIGSPLLQIENKIIALGGSLSRIKAALPEGGIETNIGIITQKFKKIPTLLDTLWSTYKDLENNPLFKERTAWNNQGEAETATPLGDVTKQLEILGGELTKIANSMPTNGADFKTNIGAISQSFSSIKSIFKSLSEITSGDLTGGKQLVGEDITNVSSVLEEFARGLSAMQGAFDEMSNVGEFGEKMAVLDQSVMTPFKNIFTSLMEMQTMMTEANAQGGGIGGMPQQTVSMAILDLMTALTTINTSVQALGDMGSFVGNVTQLNVAMNYIKSVFTKLNEIKSMIAGEGGGIGGEIGGGIGLASIGTTISGVIREINAATMQAPTILAGATMLQGAFNALRASFTSLSGIATTAQTDATTIQTAVTTLQGIGNQIINISVTIVGTVNDGGIPAKIQAVADNINTALGNIRATYEKIVTVKITGIVSDGGVPARIRAIASSIWAAYNSIPTSLTKHVTVNVSGSVNRTGTFGTGFSTGGLVGGRKPLYRAFGGFAFRPKGTDTVPAMLTPGEYVVRRKAVDTFGARFLQRINHLDVKGALHALSIKAGQSIVPNGNTIINNKTTNNNYNNYNVPITNNSHSADVGINRAGRMIHALQH